MAQIDPEEQPIPLPGGTPLAELRRLPRRPYALTLQPDAEAVEGIRTALDLSGLRKLRLTGRLDPVGKGDWHLSGIVGATVVQPCTVTLEPVTTRLDDPFERRYLAKWDQPEEGSETEMPEDDTIEPLPEVLDLMALLSEALALALPLYPRAENADFADIAVTEPGQAPMTDADARPFAGLAALRDQLSEGKDQDPDSGTDP